ncbi:MAG: hypothetical protein HC842_04135 [Cytophagales bacterium]|nr:hypothetical protein [Cytophagales bacterium]
MYLLINKGTTPAKVNLSGADLPQLYQAYQTADFFKGERVADFVDGKGVLPPSSVTTLVGEMPSNQSPTINPVPNQAVANDVGAQTLVLSGIGDGDADDEQTLQISVSTDQPALFSALSVNYAEGNTASLHYTPAPEAAGQALVTVEVSDNGGTKGEPKTKAISFTITLVNPNINNQPTMDVASPSPILEDAGEQTIVLTGMGDGDPSKTQNLTISVNASPAEIISSATVAYEQGSTTAMLAFTSAPNAFGQVVFTVTVRDDGGTENGGVDTKEITFPLTIVNVNDAPVLTACLTWWVWQLIQSKKTLTINGINPGPSEAEQQVSIQVVSSKPQASRLRIDSVVYEQGADSAIVYFTARRAEDTTVLTITLTDDGGVANGGINTLTQSFKVITAPASITAANHAETLISLHPNPAQDQVELLSSAPMMDMTLFNNLGIEVMQVDLNQRLEALIPLHYLPSGAYSLRVRTMHTVRIIRVVKK